MHSAYQPVWMAMALALVQLSLGTDLRQKSVQREEVRDHGTVSRAAAATTPLGVSSSALLCGWMTTSDMRGR